MLCAIFARAEARAYSSSATRLPLRLTLRYAAAVNRAPQSQRTYLLTFVTANRRRLFQVHDVANLMCEVLQHYRTQGKYLLHAFVVMPEHIHVLVTPAEDVSVERVVQFIKGGFSFRLKSKTDVWERGHFGKRISDIDGFKACIQYIINNPVRKQLVESAADYSFSSAARTESVDTRPKWFA